MEKSLQQVAKEALQTPKVKGYLCVDGSGLCLACEGTEFDANVSGLISSVMNLANELEPGKSPVVEIGTNNGSILIQSKESITTALFKSN